MFRLGSRVEGRHVQVLTMRAQPGPGRIGYVISRKVMRRAVDRNRLKRRLREFLRTRDPEVGAFDLVIRVKRTVVREAMDEVFREACTLVDKAVRHTVAVAR
jgi:ribonuclease P protein component